MISWSSWSLDPFGSTSSVMFWGLIFGWWAMVWMFWARLDHVGSAVPKEWLCITVSHAPDALLPLRLSLAGTGIARSWQDRGTKRGWTELFAIPKACHNATMLWSEGSNKTSSQWSHKHVIHQAVAINESATMSVESAGFLTLPRQTLNKKLVQLYFIVSTCWPHSRKLCKRITKEVWVGSWHIHSSSCQKSKSKVAKLFQCQLGHLFANASSIPQVKIVDTFDVEDAWS